MTRTPAWFALLFAGILLPGSCTRSEASFGPERPVPKDRPVVTGQSTRERLGVADMDKPGQESGDPDGGAHAVAAAWVADAPANWRSQPPDPGTFRDLRWYVDGDATAECYLTASVGGELAENVARWWKQLDAEVPAIAAGLALPQHRLLG